MKGDNRQFIKVYNEFIKEFDSREQITYATVKSTANSAINNTSILSVEAILLIQGLKLSTTTKNSACESLQILVDEGVLGLYSNLECTDAVSVVDKNRVYFMRAIDDSRYNDSYFTKLYYDDFRKFLSIDDSKSRAKMLHVYLDIVYRIYDSISSDKYTMPTIDEIEYETKINRKSISKYIKALQDEKILYCATERTARDRIKNYYCRWEDKDILDRAIERRERWD